MFGVIVCPHCTLVQGADLRMVRVTCPRCGGKIDIKRAKVYFSTDSPRDLAEGVRQVGERLVYDIVAEPSGTRRRVSRTARRRPPADEQTLRSVLLEIAQGKDVVTREDIRKALGTRSEKGLDEVIVRMLSAGIMFELAPGRYRPA